MPGVTNLVIKKQSGSDTYFASWKFSGGSAASSSNTTSAAVKVGDLVSIKAGSTYYNGVAIPSWVMSRKWYISHLSGDRAVLGKDSAGQYNIQSPIKVSNLTGGTGSSSGSTSSEPTISNDQLDHFEVEWYYYTGDDVWFKGTTGSPEETNSTYGPPANALKIKIRVKPVAKTYEKKNGTKTEQVPYFEGAWSQAEFTLASHHTPDKPGKPSVEIEKFTLTATLDNITNEKYDKIQFQIYDGSTLYHTGPAVPVVACRAVYVCTVDAGGNYRVCCRAVYVDKGVDVYSDQSEHTDPITTIPKTVENIKAVANSKTSIKVTWSAADTATSYEVEYTVDKSYFDSSSQVSSTPVESTTAYLTGLEADEWYIRVRAVNKVGSSAWSNPISTVIGTAPEPPTTWSLTTTVVVGEQIILYWTHNSEDGSKQTEAQIELTINGETNTITIPFEENEEDDEDPICQYSFSSLEYDEGAEILWKVRTKGVIDEYGEWSTQRTINLFAPPSLSMGLGVTENSVLEALPLNVFLMALPMTQRPTSYHIFVIADNSYETEDNIGNPVTVTAGTEVYSKVFNTGEHSIDVFISAGDIKLENGQSYTVKATVSMNSGLTAENRAPFTVNWTEYTFLPDASIYIDHIRLNAVISPFCLNPDWTLSGDVSLSVYRREANGTFTPIMTDLPNDRSLTIADPHPALDYARYRIVARHDPTGAVTYTDLPGIPTGEHSIVIQWDEQWSNFNYTETAEPEVHPWTGSMLKLPYNIDVSENYNNDVSLVKYIGRKHPVGYYGTQRGVSATWNTEVPKSDKETIYALRRLADWAGDVYVREPSGTGYWAQVTVSMSIKHLQTTVPVTLTINRVEGDRI